jgi:hypothetical protein
VPIITCLLLQWTVSVTCYGYFRRDLGTIERWIFGVISFAGYGALCDRGIYSNLLFGAMLLAMSAYIFLSSKSPKPAPVAPHTTVKTQPKLSDEALPVEGRFE